MTTPITSSTFFNGVKKRAKRSNQFLNKVLNDWSLLFAAMLAYNLLIALLPIAVALFGIAGLILRNYPQARQDLKNEIVNAFPSGNSSFAGVGQIVDLAFSQLSNDAGALLFVGIALAVFGSSRLFVVIEQCFSIIYRVRERGFLRQNLLAFGMLFIFLLLIPLMLAASSVPAIFLNVLPGATFTGGVVVSLLVAFVFFELIYWLIPNKKMSFRSTWCGALVAALTLELFIILFPFYVRQFMGNYAGQVGFAVILLLFFYYFATILLLGAQINAFFFDAYQPFFDGLGTYVSHMHDEFGVEKPSLLFSTDQQVF